MTLTQMRKTFKFISNCVNGFLNFLSARGPGEGRGPGVGPGVGCEVGWGVDVVSSGSSSRSIRLLFRLLFRFMFCVLAIGLHAFVLTRRAKFTSRHAMNVNTSNLYALSVQFI